MYLYQLILIYRADISEATLATQVKLARLRTTTIWVTRLLFLQLPVWSTFYLNKNMFENGTITFYVVQTAITLSFTILAVWLFKNIKFENRGKKWFKLIFDRKEWTPVLRSIELLSQISDYQYKS